MNLFCLVFWILSLVFMFQTFFLQNQEGSNLAFNFGIDTKRFCVYMYIKCAIFHIAK